MAAHRVRDDQSPDLARPVHRITQPHVWMAEQLAQRMRIAFVASHLEKIVRRFGGAMLADDQGGGDYAMTGDFFGAENIDRMVAPMDTSAKGPHRSADRFAKSGGTG